MLIPGKVGQGKVGDKGVGKVAGQRGSGAAHGVPALARGSVMDASEDGALVRSGPARVLLDDLLVERFGSRPRRRVRRRGPGRVVLSLAPDPVEA